LPTNPRATTAVMRMSSSRSFDAFFNSSTAAFPYRASAAAATAQCRDLQRTCKGRYPVFGLGDQGQGVGRVGACCFIFQRSMRAGVASEPRGRSCPARRRRACTSSLSFSRSVRALTAGFASLPT
jgi:hypothetical protein